MAYTIKEVEERTNISCFTLRFWATKGVFAFVERDKNGVKYFSDKDLEWVRWVDWLRKTGMPIKDIVTYIHACYQGPETMPMRKKMLDKQYKMLLENIADLQNIAQHLEKKIGIYADSIEQGKDLLNPKSSQYLSCKTVKKKLPKS